MGSPVNSLENGSIVAEKTKILSPRGNKKYNVSDNIFYEPSNDTREMTG